MFNFSGSEIVFLLLLALIILGPEKLPDAVRKFGKTYAEFKKVTTGFQSELKSALDEPMKEMRETADALRKAAQFDVDLDPRSLANDATSGRPQAAIQDAPTAATTAAPSTVAGNEPPLAPGPSAPAPDAAATPTPAREVEDGAGTA